MLLQTISTTGIRYLSLRIVISIYIFFSSFLAFSQQDVCGEYGIFFFEGADISVRLTIKPDSTFEYIFRYMNEYKQTGSWKKYGDVLMLYDCRDCITTEPLQIKIKGQIPILFPKRPFEYQYLKLIGDSLFVIRPINKVDLRDKLVKKKPK